jgi:hypothetical protein
MIRLASYIVRGPNHATLVVLVFAVLSLFLPVVSLFSSASLALVALRDGYKQSIRVLAGAAAVLTFSGALFSGSIIAPLVYGALMWLPAWGVALVLRHTRQLGWAVEFAVILGLVGVSVAYALVDDPGAMWQERFRILLAPLAERAAEGEIAGIDRFSDRFAPYLTGIIAAGSVSSVALSLILARWWQAALFNPGGFGAEFLAMHLHKVTHLAGIVCLVISFFGTAAAAEYFGNLLIVLAVPFVLLGFSIVHRLFSARADKRFWLAGVYVLAMVVPQFLLPVALIGITDAWVGWRERWPRRRS